MNLENYTIGFIVFPRCASKKSWMINVLEAYWLRCGAKIVYYHDIDLPVPHADVWIQHLDSSVVPEKYRIVINKLPNVLNRKLLDIRKRSFSEQRILDASNPYQGKIIVKSNDNCGGVPERRQAKYHQKKSIFGRIKNLIHKIEKTPPFAEYKVYQSLQDVPREFFNQEQAIIEKFIPQREGDYYVLYMTYIFLEIAHTLKIKSLHPIVKWDVHETWEYIATKPDIIKWAHQHHVDYGRLDYVYANNQLVVYDINKTPGLGDAKVDEVEDFHEIIGPAILDYLTKIDKSPR